MNGFARFTNPWERTFWARNQLEKKEFHLFARAVNCVCFFTKHFLYLLYRTDFKYVCEEKFEFCMSRKRSIGQSLNEFHANIRVNAFIGPTIHPFLTILGKVQNFNANFIEAETGGGCRRSISKRAKTLAMALGIAFENAKLTIPTNIYAYVCHVICDFVFVWILMLWTGPQKGNPASIQI